MKYPPPPPNEQRFESKSDGMTIYATAPGMWHPLTRLSRFGRQEAYCIAIVGWMRQARDCATAGRTDEAEVAGENAAKWLTILDELK